MARPARRRATSRGRDQARRRRRSESAAQAHRHVLPLLAGYLDAVADALRASGLTVLEVHVRADPVAGLQGAITLTASPLADGDLDGRAETGAPHASTAGLSLAWSQRTGWTLSVNREPRDDRSRRYLHPDRAPDPDTLARVLHAVLAGRHVATPTSPSEPSRQDDLPALLDALAQHASRRQ